MIKMSIIGAHGVPAKYGGYCTLAQYLADFKPKDFDLTIYCCTRDYPEGQPSMYKNVHLKWVNLPARGTKAFAYASVSLYRAVRAKSDCILICGSNSGFFMPFLFRKKHLFFLNIGGIEWQRNKYSPVLQRIVRFLMKCAVHSSRNLIADNEGIREYIEKEYGRHDSTVIAYGGDQAKKELPTADAVSRYPFMKGKYAVAVARIQSDNNVEMLLDAFKNASMPLVYIGNWNVTEWASQIRAKYSGYPNLILLDAIYEMNTLNQIRSNCSLYVHGHSAGGTNPSLVEAMHCEVPLACFDNGFNNNTTMGRAMYFKDVESLSRIVEETDESELRSVAAAMKSIAMEHYTWEGISKQYYDFIRENCNKQK